MAEHFHELETDIIDPAVFKTVLRTLLKNAVENTPDEGVITVSLSPSPEGVLLVVKDRGMGVSARDRDFIFKAFHHTQQTDRYSTKRPFDFNAGGKGLELMRLKILSESGFLELSFESVRCRYIANASGECPGRISLCRYVADAEQCRESGGTTFTVLFLDRMHLGRGRMWEERTGMHPPQAGGEMTSQ